MIPHHQSNDRLHKAMDLAWAQDLPPRFVAQSIGGVAEGLWISTLYPNKCSILEADSLKLITTLYKMHQQNVQLVISLVDNDFTARNEFYLVEAKTAIEALLHCRHEVVVNPSNPRCGERICIMTFVDTMPYFSLGDLRDAMVELQKWELIR